MALEADWAMARVGGGLDKLVLRFHSGERRQGDEGVMASAKDALVPHCESIFAAFDLYAMSGASADFTSVQLNAYRDFLGDCGLIESGAEGCLNAARWDELFIVINASGGGGGGKEEADQYNHKKGINRQEWVSLITRAAVMRFLMPEYRREEGGTREEGAGGGDGGNGGDRKGGE